jgi:hypothetical protein
MENRMALSRNWKWTGLLLAGVLSTTACFGPFNLTQRYWHWNGHVTENKWANEGIFLLSVIIPVYGVTTFVDAIVLNSVEFWTGKNWVDAPSSSSKATGKLDDHHEYTLTRLSATQIKAEVFEDGRLVSMRIIDQGNGVNSVLRDENGVALVSAAEQLDGSIEVVAAR